LHGVSCRQWASLPEQLRQLARAASDVLNDEEGGRNFPPQTGREFSQRPIPPTDAPMTTTAKLPTGAHLSL
jgi:hypothetical protein